MVNPKPSLADELEEAYAKERENISKATEGIVEPDVAEMVAINYAFEATQHISDAIMRGIEKLDEESAAFFEARFVADRIIQSWSTFVRSADVKGVGMHEPLRQLLKDLSSPTSSEELMMIVSDNGLYKRTSKDFKTILTFYQEKVPEKH